VIRDESFGGEVVDLDTVEQRAPIRANAFEDEPARAKSDTPAFVLAHTDRRARRNGSIAA
jgi:hypothetical protein